MEREINFELFTDLDQFLFNVTRGFFLWGIISIIFYITVIFAFDAKVEEYSKTDVIFLIGIFIFITIHLYSFLNQFFAIKNTISKISIENDDLIIESYTNFFLIKINKEYLKTERDLIRIEKSLYPIRDKFLKGNIYSIYAYNSDKKYYLLMDFFDPELKDILLEK